MAVVVCDVCSVRFEKVTWPNFGKHMRTHLNYRPYKCRFCGKRQTVASNLERHEAFHCPRRNTARPGQLGGFEKQEIGDLQYVKRSKYYKNLPTLRRHQQLHQQRHNEEEKAYECDQCEKRYALQKYLANHIALSHHHRQMRCDDCQAIFSSEAGLFCHVIKSHFGVRTAPLMICDECGEAFSQAVLLQCHVRSSHWRARYKITCDGCQKKYAHWPSLYKHSKHCSYRQAKKFECDVCNQSLRRKHDFVSHAALVHGGTLLTGAPKMPHSERTALQCSERFPCPICGRSFSQKGYLRFHHMRSHVDSERFASNAAHARKKHALQCDLCDRSFFEKNNLFKHTAFWINQWGPAQILKLRESECRDKTMSLQ